MESNKTCSADLVLSLVNNYCLITDDYIWSNASAAICFMSLMIAIFLLWYSSKVSRMIVERKDPESTTETFCVLSLQIVMWTRWMLTMAVILLTFSTFSFLIRDYYGKWFYSKDYQDCKSSHMNGLILNFVLTMSVLKDTISQTFIFIQIFEWVSIINLIRQQRGKSDREIIIDI
jgi:hypothetical protein